MMDTDGPADDDRRRATCPHCKTEEGRPRAVSYANGVKRLVCVCGNCHFEWQVTSLDTEPRPR